MKTVIATLSDRGKREINEDSLSPAEELAAKGLFIVCDGVGGAAGGERASRLVCTVITDYFNKNVKTGRATKENIDEAVKLASLRLSDHLRLNPADHGLSTTLAMLYINEQSVLIAHSGDSRVYHIRNGQILFKTEDHSFVNDLVWAGLITSQEAATHPRRNIISRFISADNETTKPDIHQVHDLRKKDYFLICSDGILEGIDEQFMTANFVSEFGTISAGSIMDKIGSICSERSVDNYSAIIVQLL